MNIALIGYGRMGKEVELVAKEKGLKVVSIFTEKNNTGGLGITPDSVNTRAKSRRGFALGAVVAAEWLKGKKGFYTIRSENSTACLSRPT